MAPLTFSGVLVVNMYSVGICWGEIRRKKKKKISHSMAFTRVKYYIFQRKRKAAKYHRVIDFIVPLSKCPTVASTT